VELEKRGVATITLVTTAFETLARYQARAMGYPDLRLLVIKHPLGSITEEELTDRVLHGADIVADLFPGRPDS